MARGFMLLSVLGTLISLMMLTPLLVGWFFRAAHDRAYARQTAMAILLAGSVLEKMKAGRNVERPLRVDDLQVSWSAHVTTLGVDEVEVRVLRDGEELFSLCTLMRKRR